MAYRDQLFQLKPEGTSGTLESFTGADVIRCGEISSTLQDFSVVDRPMLSARPGMPLASTMVERTASFVVPLDFGGSGTPGTASGLDKVLLAASLNKAVVNGASVTYGLAWPPSATTYSVGYMLDGVRYATPGARVATLEYSATAGQALTGSATFRGLYRAPSTLANPAPTFPAQVPSPVLNSANVTAGSALLNSVGICLEALSIKIENDLQLHDRGGCVPSLEIAGRTVTGEFTIERPAIATLDVMALAANSTVVPLVLPIGTTAGNIITTTMPQIQILPVGEVDLKGRVGLKFGFQMISELSSQELSIAFT